jgi:DNA-directed RNA polymerase specialized sigma24 family protein
VSAGRVVAVKTYTAVCERVGGWWEITVPELDGRVTQAKRLDQVEEMVRSLVSLIVDVPADSFEVAIQPVLPDSASEEVRRARELRGEADRIAEAASMATRRAVRQLAGMGLTVRDIGTMLRLTPQRVSQLLGSGFQRRQGEGGKGGEGRYDRPGRQTSQTA